MDKLLCYEFRFILNDINYYSIYNIFVEVKEKLSKIKFEILG